MNRIVTALIFLASIIFSTAVPIGRTTIQHLLDQSPLVIKGTIIEIGDISLSRPPWAINLPDLKIRRAKVDLSYALKGVAPPTPVNVILPYVSPDHPLVALREGSTYIFFLASHEAFLKVVDPFNGAIPVMRGMKPENTSDPNLLLRFELEESLASTNSFVVLKALMALGEVGANSSLEEVNRLADSTNDSVRVAACAVALALGEWGKAPEIVRFLNQHSRFSGEIVLSESDNGLDVGFIAKSLSLTSSSEAQSTYIKLLDETQNPYVLKELLAAPCIISSTTSAITISHFLNNPNDDVAYAAYRALMTMKGSDYKAQHLFVRERANTSRELKSWLMLQK